MTWLLPVGDADRAEEWAIDAAIAERAAEAEILVFDGRRCRRHPEVTISSPDGMFDGLCHKCEVEYDREVEETRMSDEEIRRERWGGEVVNEPGDPPDEGEVPESAPWEVPEEGANG